MSLIEKSKGDYELKRKSSKNDMSVEAMMEALPENMYEKLNDSPDIEGKKMRNVEKRLNYKTMRRMKPVNQKNKLH